MPLTPGSSAACLSTASSQCTIDSFVSRSQSCRSSRVTSEHGFNPPPTCLALSLLSLLASSQIPAPRTTLAETPLLEVCPAKVGPRYLVFHQHFSWVSGHHLSGSLHSHLSVECTVAAIWGPGYSVRVPFLRLRNSPDARCACLHRQPLLGDNHCVWRRVQHASKHSRVESWFPHSSSWLGWQVHYLLSKFQDRRVVLSLHAACAAVSFRRSPVHQLRSKFHQPAQYPYLSLTRLRSMKRFKILPLFTSLASSPVTCFFISYVLDIILMRNSTADGSPPTGMSSPCPVATICAPLMQPCHTHGHAIPRVNLRSLRVDASSSSPCCAASRVQYKLYCNSPHTC